MPDVLLYRCKEVGELYENTSRHDVSITYNLRCYCSAPTRLSCCNLPDQDAGCGCVTTTRESIGYWLILGGIGKPSESLFVPDNQIRLHYYDRGRNNGKCPRLDNLSKSRYCFNDRPGDDDKTQDSGVYRPAKRDDVRGCW